METLYRTPLLDLFHKGEIPDDVRMLAARGGLALPAHEQLALLILLTDDADEGIALVAQETIGRIPREKLRAFLRRHEVAEGVREFFRARGFEPGGEEPSAGAVPDDAPLLAPSENEAPAATPGQAPEEPADDDKEATAQRLAKMSVAERIKSAMLGTREERFILIRDVNRLVAAAVLSSPKLSESDVDAFAKMANVSEEVLRTIAQSRVWMKRYTVVSAITTNPKTPVSVTLGLVGRLNERDLKAITRDRNMQEPLRAAARRALQNLDARKS